MENIDDKKFLTRELAIKTLNDWAKEHGKKPTQEELEECIDIHWEKDGKWMMSNMD
jgi:DNA-directed RNA polymerase specialized sigma subunit